MNHCRWPRKGAAQRKLYPNLPAEVEVIDCTLRDGEQAPGVWFTLEEKVDLATRLDDAGVDLLDAGFPATSDSDLEAIQEMRRRGIRAGLAATARPVGADVARAEAARADEVFLFMPTSDFRLRQTLGMSRARASGVFLAGAEDVVSRGMRLNLVFEDASRADVTPMLRLVEQISARVPVRRLVICDTVGASSPASMERLIGRFHAAFGRQIVLCTHCHNDFGLAVANTLSAVGAGAQAVTCTVNGIGERAGNADLAETVAALTHVYRVRHHVDPDRLVPLSRLVEGLSGIHTSAIKPVTGFNVYRHESGVHVDGMLKDPLSYEYLPAGWVGRQTEYVLGKHSGSALVRALLDEGGFPVTEDVVARVLHGVKAATERRSKAGHQEMFAQVEAFRRSHLSGIDPGVLFAALERETAGAGLETVPAADGAEREPQEQLVVTG